MAGLGVLVALVLALVGCGDDDTVAPSADVVSVIVAPDSITLPAIQATYRVLVTAVYADAREADVTTAPATAYASEETGVAGVGGGVVSAAGAGSTRVIATFAGMSDTAIATVDESAAIGLASLATEPAGAIALLPGETATVRASALWENGARLDASGLPFAYASSDPAVASVSPNGIVTAQNPGTALLTVSFRGASSEIAVTVSIDRLRTFDRDVFPILFGRCTLPQCHPAEPAPAQRGLRLDSYESLMAGGANGPVVVPGDPAASRLVLALRGVLPSTLRMPLGSVLSGRNLEIIEDWIAQGACRSEGDCPASGGNDGFARRP